MTENSYSLINFDYAIYIDMILGILMIGFTWVITMQTLIKF